MADALKEWEGFAVESDGNRIALRQVVSGLYIGGHIANDKTPHLVPKRDAWEMFSLESRGGRDYAIRSHDNTYLTLDGHRLRWRSNTNGHNDRWTFITVQPAPHQFNQGFSQQGNTGLGYSNDGKLHGHLVNWFSNFGKAQNFSVFPNPGEEVALTRNGLFVGVTSGNNEEIGLAQNNKEWEKLYLENHNNGTYSFKQKVSGHYLGSEIGNNLSPRWAKHNKEWEKFAIEDRGNGNVAIKSYHNTYLTGQGNKLVWQTNPTNGTELFRFDRPHSNHGQGFNAQISNNSNSYGLPSVGNVISFSQGNRHVGGVNQQNQTPEFRDVANAWEKFTVESGPNGKVALKQVDSNLYLGGHIQNGTSPVLVPKAQDW